MPVDITVYSLSLISALILLISASSSALSTASVSWMATFLIEPSRGSLSLRRFGARQPIPVTCPASSEAIDALLGTKGGSPRVVPDETKLAITNSASRDSATPKTFGAVQHCSLLLVSSSLFVDHPSFTVALHEPVRFDLSAEIDLRADNCAFLTLSRSRSNSRN
jgi:hypothetical protein